MCWRRSGAKFPDLVFLLHGEGVHILLRGKTDIIERHHVLEIRNCSRCADHILRNLLPAGRYSLIGGLRKSLRRAAQRDRHDNRAEQRCDEPIRAHQSGRMRPGREGRHRRRARRETPPACHQRPGRHAARLRKGREDDVPQGLQDRRPRSDRRLSTSGKKAITRGRALEVKVAVTPAGRTGSTTISRRHKT